MAGSELLSCRVMAPPGLRGVSATCSASVAPGCSVACAGDSDKRREGDGVTLTLALREEPLSETVTSALPLRSPVTGMATCVCPAAKATDAGTLTVSGSSELTASTPGAVGAGLSVACSTPLAPCLSASVPWPSWVTWVMGGGGALGLA
ncbi:hypothetical protein FQZ97_1018830 [compost metagenome]